MENSVLHAVRSLLNDTLTISDALHKANFDAHTITGIMNAASAVSKKLECKNLLTFLERVQLQPDGLRITLSLASLLPAEAPISITHDVHMQMQRRGIEMRLVIGNTPSKADPTLIKAITRARAWFAELASGKAKNMVEIAIREGTSRTQVSYIMNLACLAPAVIEAIIAGQQPVNLTADTLMKNPNLPLDWNEQCRMFLPQT